MIHERRSSPISIPASSWTRNTLLARCSPVGGFTLLEVVIVVLLTAILMGALAHVLTTVLGDAYQQTSSNQVVSEQVSVLLRRDIANSRFYRVSPNLIELRGPLMLEPKSHQALLVEAEVRYQIKATSVGNLLVRVQNSRTATERQRSNTYQTVTPFWLGIDRIRFDTTYLDQSATSASTEAAANGWKPMPPSCRLQLFGEFDELLLSENLVGVET